MPTKYTPPVTPFLSKDERAMWADEKKEFFVCEAEKVQGDFGAAANYCLQTFDKAGKPSLRAYISFALTDQKTGSSLKRRVDELEWFIENLPKSGDGLIGPMILVRIPTTKGNPAWSFEAAG